MNTNNIVNFDRDLFNDTIESIRKQMEHDAKCSKAFRVILPDDYISGYNNYTLTTQLLKLVKIAFDDNHRDSWIDYFIYELEFGSKYIKGCVTGEDGTDIALDCTDGLYDFLVKNKKDLN